MTEYLVFVRDLKSSTTYHALRVVEAPDQTTANQVVAGTVAGDDFGERTFMAMPTKYVNPQRYRCRTEYVLEPIDDQQDGERRAVLFQDAPEGEGELSLAPLPLTDEDRVNAPGNGG